MVRCPIDVDGTIPGLIRRHFLEGRLGPMSESAASRSCGSASPRLRNRMLVRRSVLASDVALRSEVRRIHAPVSPKAVWGTIRGNKALCCIASINGQRRYVSPQTWDILYRVGTFATVIGLAYVIYDHHVLAVKVAQLQSERPLATATAPATGTSLAAKEAATITGYFSSDVPSGKEIRAVLHNDQAGYSISRKPIEIENNRGWRLTIYPWTGTWRLFFLVADRETAKELDRWRDEKNAARTDYDWENSRIDLPTGVVRHFVAEYPTYARK